MDFLELPRDIIWYILSFAKYNDEPHIIYKMGKPTKYIKIFYKGGWKNNTFDGYGTLCCRDSDYCNVPLDEPFNITILNTFYKYIKES